jgi:hypothetical protein
VLPEAVINCRRGVPSSRHGELLWLLNTMELYNCPPVAALALPAAARRSEDRQGRNWAAPATTCKEFAIRQNSDSLKPSARREYATP